MTVADLRSGDAQEAGAAHQDPGHRQEDRRAPAARAEGQARARPAPPPAAGQHASDVVNALVALGYSDKEALAAVKGLPPGLPVAEGIRAALKALAKS